MDLQVSQDFGYTNSNYNYNYDIIVYSSLFTVCIIAISAFDYIKFKNDVYNETEKNRKIMSEIEFLKKQNYVSRSTISDLESHISVLESHISFLEKKTKNINKNTNSALEQHLDYVNRQLLIQTASIEEVHSKLLHETEENRSRLSRSICDVRTDVREHLDELRATISSQMAEFEEEQSILSNKIDDVHFGVTTKLVEKMKLDKQVAYDMYRYLYFGFMEGSISEAMQGFFKHFYEFEFDPKMDTNIDKILNDTHPVRINRNNS
jgi:hypothetical protein